MDEQQYLGKCLLIGITFLDGSDKVIEQFQTYGPIVAVNDHGIVIEKTDGSGTFKIPPDTSSLKPARRGQYRLRATGEILDDPDFISTWTVKSTKPEMIEEYKASGFPIAAPN